MKNATFLHACSGRAAEHFTNSWPGRLVIFLAMLALVLSTTYTLAATAVYVSEHYEVRTHDEPVKYIFNGDTRVARVTGSLTSNTLIQRLRLNAGWNLCSVAVGGMPLPRRLAGQSADLVIAAHKWNPATRSWTQIPANESLVAGTVLWLRASTNAVLAVPGTSPGPAAQIVAGGGSFHGSAGMTPAPLRSESGETLRGQAGYDSASQAWRLRQLSIPIADTTMPDFIPPGQAVFIHTDAPTELEQPNPSERMRYYHQDHLGSSSVMTDAEGMLVEETAFYPFGLARSQHRAMQLEEFYEFTQKERDDESGLHYFKARYLVGWLSRFATLDPKYANPDALSAGDQAVFLASPQRLNLYAYVSNNPLKSWDPTGLDEQKSPALVDVADTYVDRMGFLADANKLKGPGLAFDVIGVTIKTGKFVDKPSTMRGMAVAYDTTKAVLTAKCPPAGLALQALDLIGIGPGSVIDSAADAEDRSNALINEMEKTVDAYKQLGETYRKVGEVHRAATVRTQAETKERVKQVADTEDLIRFMDERKARSDAILRKARQRR